MNTTGKIQNKGQVTIPTVIRRQAGLGKGDLVNFSFQRGKIIVTPRVVIDHSKFPTANDEYTQAQRRVIDGRLAEGLADIKAGRVYGPFDTHQEVMNSLRSRGKKSKAKTSKRAVR